ncbi:MAG: calcium/sodium antiporter [Erysipelotrichaceae bacterium]|nr:calcium/sodium antiporter [Erysipelotrichaceae bacterium]
MLINVLLLVLGLGFIIKGGDWFVDSAIWMAKITKIPPFIIGATIVSLATTVPEVLVSVLATAQGSTDLALGNAIGSIIANIGLIMGISLFVAPPKTTSKDYIIKGLYMVGAALVLIFLSLDGELSKLQSIILWVLLIGFFVLNITTSQKQEDIEEVSFDKKYILLFILGAVSVVIGARLLVDNGVAIARALNISEAIIGLTIVAVGTSLPELVTTITALIKKNSNLSLGNIVGANIMNILLVIPASTLVSNGGLVMRMQTVRQDIPFSVLFMLIAMIPPLLFKRFFKWQGLLMLVTYGLYLLITVL